MKKLLALLLSLSLLAGTVPALAAQGNVPSWATKAYDHLEELDLPVHYLQPTQTADRSYFIRLLVQAMELAAPPETLTGVERVQAGHFADDDSDYVLAAATYGITEGKLVGGQLVFDPYGQLTRQEAAKMVCAALDFLAGQGYAVEPTGEPAVYADEADIPDWAAPFTARIAAYGLMQGDQNGNFMPTAHLDVPSAVVLVSRVVDLLSQAAVEESGLLLLNSALDWSGADAFGANDYQMSKPKTGWAQGYYTAVDGDGAFTGVVVGSDAISVERYDETGAVVFSKSLLMELPIFGAFLAGEDCYYVAFGQENDSENDSAETFRIVKYDGDWNRVGAVSANGGETYTTYPFRSAVARMALSQDGKTLALHAARQRYTSGDGLRHQSNITFLVDTDTMEFQALMGEEFPANHVSHSFGQFVRFDGGEMVTVDHGDAYPRSFVLQRAGRATDLLELYGETGANVTNAIGSGFEVSEDGYLFLGCSDPQTGTGGPWNVFLSYVEKTDPQSVPSSMTFDGVTVSLTKPSSFQGTLWTMTVGGTNYYITGLSGGATSEDLSAYVNAYIDAIAPGTRFSWLTHSEATVNCARLVKVDDNTFAALWDEGGDLHLQLLDGQGNKVGAERVHPLTPMPSTQPVVYEGHICYIQVGTTPLLAGAPVLYRIPIQ